MRQSLWYRLDKDHQPYPVKIDENFRDMTMQEKRVAETTVQTQAHGEIWVSTVFLGLDHGWDGGPPVLFESMAFAKDGVGDIDYAEKFAERYCTWEEAVKGHQNIVDKLNAGALELYD
jgi:hypothetical protein